jgi:hypothetical protein
MAAISVARAGPPLVCRAAQLRGQHQLGSCGRPAVVYSDTTGELFWDATGGSTSDQVLIAKLNNSPELLQGDLLLM